MGNNLRLAALVFALSSCSRSEDPTAAATPERAPAGPTKAAPVATPAIPAAPAPPAPPPQAGPAIDVAATQLLADYQANEVGADAKYRRKELRVSGRVEKIGKDIGDEPYVALATGDDPVHASFDGDGELGTLRRGQRLTVRCLGGGMSLGLPLLTNCAIEETPIDVAHTNAVAIAVDAYAAWSAKHPKSACPSESAPLLPFVKISYDPWGEKFRVFCNPSAPRGKRLRISSNGPDRKPDTEDDIKSWE